MIDPLTEELISLSQASEFCPPRRNEKKPHRSCLYRWTSEGCKGVILDSIQVGGTRCTSREALARFFRELTQQQQSAVPRKPVLTTSPQQDIEDQLDAEGL